MSNDAIKPIVRHLARISSPRQGPILDIDPHSFRHTRYLENKKYTVDHVARVSEVEDPECMYAAMICSYVMGQLDEAEQQALIGYIKGHIKPRGYVVLSLLIKEGEEEKEESVRGEFGWHRVRTSKSKTISFHTGDTHPCLDVILQKPEE